MVVSGESNRPIGQLVFTAEIVPAVVITHHGPPVNLSRIRRYEISTPGSAEVFSINAADLIIGPNTRLTPGKFYRDVLGLTFKCLSSEGESATMIQLDLRSGQGSVTAVRFTMDTRYRIRYVEIEDSALCAELEGRLQKITRSNHQ